MRDRAAVSFGHSMQLPGGQAGAAIALRELHMSPRDRIHRWLGGLFTR